MKGDPTALGRLALGVLAVADNAIDEVDAGALIERRYFACGSEPAEDGPQLTVALAPAHMGPAGQPKFEWLVPGDASFGDRNVTFTITVVVPDAASPAGGTIALLGAPTEGAEQAAAVMLADAAWAIFIALEEAVDDDTLLGPAGRGLVGPLTPRPASGGYAACDIAFSAQLI